MRDGQDLAEFALLLALIAIVAIIALVFVGTSLFGDSSPTSLPPSGA